MLDIMVKNAIVLTMAGKGIGLIKDGAIGIKGNTIVCVDDTVCLEKQHKAKRVIDAKGKILLPGFIDTHCHSYYGVMCRGILTDLEFFLEQGIAAYDATLDIEKSKASCRAHLLEGMKRGITTFSDMGSHYDVLTQIHEEFGVRARIAEQMRELPWDIKEFLGGDYQFDRKYAQPSIDAMNRLLDRYGTDPNEKISVMVSFQALDYVTEELVVELREIAKKRGAMIHTHMAQSTYECEQVEKRYGARPVETFERLGLLNENTLAAHLVYNTREENEKAAKSGLRMAYCPYSWGEVGCTPPSAQFVYHGGTVGLGTDEAAYTSVNPMSNMKTGHLSANVDGFKNDMPNVSMSLILRMHTIEAARALGMEKQIGSLEPGKRADLILLDPNTINMLPILIQPLTNIPQNIVSAASGNEIEMVMIDGQIVVEDRVVKTADEKAIMEETQRLAQAAAEDAAAYFEKLESSEVLDRQRWFEEV